ncbi:MAG: DUF4340 domain-containing protein [Candidatus Cloacimonadaceae bacterium]|jgi:hypothetical protein|nr:DUF4340 domain-containing protein [Candidatus Cloacimonadota bacterium]MCB5257858.1 DUF4340 domain-containing protein [Candidatus Cloacimonadota bacterium]MDD5624874.1 DUF4340 domain-containing protein [Candidatus Cloacimonadota bacterium]MDY0111707.1 DUF4340 domain-containing protein [Candidatus Syntrophosphaera sp.]
MKKNKIILIIVFLALLIVAIYLLTTRQEKETLKPIFPADSTSIVRIEIADPDTSIIITKINNQWQITYPIKWEVNEDHFKMFWTEVLREQYSIEPIASGKAALNQYSLTDTTALKIKVYDNKNKLIKEVWFSDLNNPADYFCFKGDNNVYQIKRKVCLNYPPKLDLWRSSYALRIFPEQLLAIEVKYTKNSYKLTRKGNIWHYKDSKEDFDIPPGNVTMGKILNALASLGSGTIFTRDNAPKLETPACSVKLILTDNSTIQIEMYPGEKNYFMTIDRYPDLVFEVPFDTYFRFTRFAATFRAKEGDPEELLP